MKYRVKHPRESEIVSWFALVACAGGFTVMSCSPPQEAIELNDEECIALDGAGQNAALALQLTPEATLELNGMTRDLCNGHLPEAGADCAVEALEQGTAQVLATGDVKEAVAVSFGTWETCSTDWRVTCLETCAREAGTAWSSCKAAGGTSEECASQAEAAAQSCNPGCPSDCKLDCIRSVQHVMGSCLDAGGAVDECLLILRREAEDCTSGCGPDPFAIHPESGDNTFVFQLDGGGEGTLKVGETVGEPVNFYLIDVPQDQVEPSPTFQLLTPVIGIGSSAALGQGVTLTLNVPGQRTTDRLVEFVDWGESHMPLETTSAILSAKSPDGVNYAAVARPNTPRTQSLEPLPGAPGTSGGQVVARVVENITNGWPQALQALANPANGTTHLLTGLNLEGANPGSQVNFFPSYSEPMPGGAGDNFALLATFTLNVPVSGNYTFRLDGDDYWIFFLEGRVFRASAGVGTIQGFDTVANLNGGCSSVTYVSIFLPEGEQSGKILYGQGGGGAHFSIDSTPGDVVGNPEAGNWRPLGYPGQGSEELLGKAGPFVVRTYSPTNSAEVTTVDQAKSIIDGGFWDVNGTGTVDTLDLNDAGAFNCGAGHPFPDLPTGVDNDNFITTVTGTISAPQAGTYNVSVYSDDGNQIHIDGAQIEIISSAGNGAVLTAPDTVKFNSGSANTDTHLRVTLSEGDHPITITHFENRGGAFFKVTVGTEGRERPLGSPGGLVEDSEAQALTFTGSGTLVSETQGGHVTAEGGGAFVDLNVLPNTLSSDRVISIRPVDLGLSSYKIGTDSVQSLGPAFNFQPSGTIFTSSVPLSIFGIPLGDLSTRQVSGIQVARLLGAGRGVYALGPTSLAPGGTGTMADFQSWLNRFSTYSLVYPADSDRDGVFDSYAGEVDECPRSDLRAAVQIRECEVPNTLDARGCTIADRIALGVSYGSSCREICDDGADNDNDGLADCDDGDCAGERICRPCGLAIVGPTAAAFGGTIDLEADYGGLGPQTTWLWSIESGAGRIEGAAGGPTARVLCAGEGPVVVLLVAADATCGALTARHTILCAPCVEEPDEIEIVGPETLLEGSLATLNGVARGADSPGATAISWQIVSGPVEIVGSASGATLEVRCLAAGEALVEVSLQDGACGNVTRATRRLTCAARPGGIQLPGDCNQDAAFDIADPICLLGFLFLGAPSRLPCEGAVDEDPNLALIDANGDRKVDLTDGIYLLAYLFGGCAGQCPPHVGGTECRAIEGCPQTCQGPP